MNFDEGAQKRTRLHPGAGDRVDEAVRVAEQVAVLAVRGLLKRPGDISRVTLQAAQFDDVELAVQVSRRQTDGELR